jgi:hypothetical protein
VRIQGQNNAAADTAIQSIVVAPSAQFGPRSGVAQGYAHPTPSEGGPNHYVQWVNVRFAVFDKTTGAMLPGFPKPGNAVWDGFGGDCENRNDGDPIVQYDQLADRWILTQFAVATRNYMQCVAVSATGDPTGAYYRYSFDYNDFPDYPKLTVWGGVHHATCSKNPLLHGQRRARKGAMMAGGGRAGLARRSERLATAGRAMDRAPPAGTRITS